MDCAGMKTLCITMLCAVLAACVPEPAVTPTCPRPKWLGGEFVKSPLTEQRGQVIAVICFKGNAQCLYQVRWADEPKKAHWVNEFELSTT